MENLLNETLASQSQRLINGLDAIEAARQLHERLIEEPNLARQQRVTIAREIAGLLFSADAGQNVPSHVRLIMNRLRADADHRAGLSDTEGLRSPSEVWDYY